ncbi:MAG TPA: DNA translocase FtsK 4TM domain-containing protein, partial [Aquabacterium sp.]|nr:DNA translocase FtsK 4TM domain-containing protein [Aquabacterium sp.]
MTFPLGSLQSDGGAPASRVGGRLHRVPVTASVEPSAPIEHTFRFQAALLIGGVLWVLALLALLSYDRLDPAFTTSGQHLEPHNWVGQAGAYGADLLQMLFGHSAWWLLLIGLR